VYPRWFADPGVPEAGHGAARFWRSLGARAAARALGDPPGPVHINLPFREPLVPDASEVSLGAAAGGRRDGAPWHRTAVPVSPPAPGDVAALGEMLRHASSVAVVAGTTRKPAQTFLDVCADFGWPLFAEPTANIRRPGGALAAGELLVADSAFRETHGARLVLQVGAAPTTRAMQTFVAQAAQLVVVTDHNVPDPGRDAELVLGCDADALARALRDAGVPMNDRWRQGWLDADSAVRSAVDELLDSWVEPFEGRIARDVAASTHGAATLFAGSSMPVRDLAVYMAPHASLRVLANRGTSGIDGSVSSALGIAAVTQPAIALIGDLALLHDASALLWSGESGLHLTLVVVDNDGGGIFNLLPQASLNHQEFERLFGTPHGAALDLESLARAAGAGYQRVTAAAHLYPALAAAQRATGVQLVHVVVDRARSPELRAAVAARVRSVVAGLSARPARAASPRT
jgi:2-succinyl-5-enolpyruvyl-6-hydroxy-3-cyclohexene-1-carboxylate synthase